MSLDVALFYRRAVSGFLEAVRQLLLNIYNSAGDDTARLNAHATFVDPSSPRDARSRRSIELRSRCFPESLRGIWPVVITLVAIRFDGLARTNPRLPRTWHRITRWTPRAARDSTHTPTRRSQREHVRRDVARASRDPQETDRG